MEYTNTNFVVMPEHINVYNASHERCDMLIGPCSCGAWHRMSDWQEKIKNASEYLKNGKTEA